MASKLGSPVALLFHCQLIHLFIMPMTQGDDATIMKQLASPLSPTPIGWNNSYHPCEWSGISCDTSLRVLGIDLSDYSLRGTLPNNLNSLSHLNSLKLEGNRLSGSIPSFANMNFLQHISLESNNFDFIPDNAFAGLTSLQSLSLYDNPKLSSWTIPIQLRDCRTLTNFSASISNLVGSIPDIFSSLPFLQLLDLSYNHLSGSLPPSLSGSSIAFLWLSNQTVGLSGPLDVLANMTSLQWIYLDGNKFTGPVPDLSICKSLTFLELQDNKLQGPFPDFSSRSIVFATLGSATENSFCKVTPGPCDQQVMILLQVAEALGYPVELADGWKGNNACKQWRFVRCDSSGNVISIDFAGQGFTGIVSPAFGNLTSLVELRLNGNNLTGMIPKGLTRLIRLRTLDLSDNNILPPLPHFVSNVNVTISGNSHLLRSPTAKAPPGLVSVYKVKSSRRKIIIKIVLPILLGVLVSLMSATGIVVKRKHLIKQQKEAQQLENSLELLPDSPVRFTSEILKAATNNFNEQQKLGGGGFGTVFEGILSDGSRIAVKRLDRFNQGKKEFLAEVRTMGSIQHLNLVRLVGFCAEKTQRLLVYEYMSNGSLDRWIFHNNSRSRLNWDIRKRIIVDIAKGLAYLHEECIKRIAHLDVKPQNVLLDEGFNAKLSDFGLAKLIDRDQSHVMTQMRGTRGYLAPEWLDRKITEKADIYSYGVLVLEAVFERKNLDSSPHEESDNRLIHIVRKKVEANSLSDLLNSFSEEDMQQNSQGVEKTIKLALWCLHKHPKRRPSMSMVVKILEGSVSMDLVSDYDMLCSSMDESATRDSITHVSNCLLSGPR